MKKFFKTQKEATEYFGRSWRYIKRFYKIGVNIGWVGGELRKTGYVIEK